jgi:hypothetical protein
VVHERAGWLVGTTLHYSLNLWRAVDLQWRLVTLCVVGWFLMRRIENGMVVMWSDQKMHANNLLYL